MNNSSTFNLLCALYDDFKALAHSPVLAMQMESDIAINKLNWLKFYLEEDIDCSGKPKMIVQVSGDAEYENLKLLYSIKNLEDFLKDWREVKQKFNMGGDLVGVNGYVSAWEIKSSMDNFYSFDEFLQRRGFTEVMYNFLIKKYSEE